MCKEAAEKLGLDFESTDDVAGWPKGCYDNNGDVYFNQHISGSNNHFARQICYNLS